MLAFYAVFIFILGAFGYGGCELLWRGYTHWSMLIAGGICFSVFYFSEKKFYPLSLFYRCIYGGVVITSVEFVFGCVFNVALGFNVWDYSAQAFNIMGQICPKFFILWVLMCIPLSFICKKLRCIAHNRIQNHRPTD